MSSKRPVHEILQPLSMDQSAVIENHFTGMTDEKFTYEMFESTRSQLIKSIHSKLTLKDKELLMSFDDGNPVWPDTDYSVFPGVRWKLLNLISAWGFVMRSRNACQYWRSTEKSNAGIALAMVSRFFRAFPIMACSMGS